MKTLRQNAVRIFLSMLGLGLGLAAQAKQIEVSVA